ncbi:hypothetical protein [Marinobacterium aestuariivivens]|uniref:Uncharacterized protein n=1 Tax=Marinobacterium aestuariivivens TaxID=1698799 RepID=A0ABW1ZY00_9GAMM
MLDHLDLEAVAIRIDRRLAVVVTVEPRIDIVAAPDDQPLQLVMTVLLVSRSGQSQRRPRPERPPAASPTRLALYDDRAP